MLLGYRIFSFLRCFVRIHIFQFLRRDEKDFVRNFRLNVSVKSVYIVAEVLNRIVNGRNRFFQIFFGSLFLCDNFFPVPLVNINGMKVIEVFVSSDGVHIGVDAVSRLDSVFAECHSLPLCKGLYDFHFQFVNILKCKAYSSFRAVQVVVETGLRVNKKRCRYTAKLQSVC